MVNFQFVGLFFHLMLIFLYSHLTLHECLFLYSPSGGYETKNTKIIGRGKGLRTNYQYIRGGYEIID